MIHRLSYILPEIFKQIRRRLLQIVPLVVGLCICKIPFLRSYRLKLLGTWQDPEKRNSIDNFLWPEFFTVWIRFEYLPQKNPDKRELLKSLAMGGNSGKNWAEMYDSRGLEFSQGIGHLSYREADPLFDALDEILLQNVGRRLCVCQIGSSSGKEIAYFAKKYPEFSFLGTDIYREVVEYSAAHHGYPNLTFELFSANNICERLNSLTSMDTVIVFSSGSLQYVQPEHLSNFFRQLGSIPHVEIVLTEPGSESKGSPDKLRGSVWRGNFGYTHDYRFYAEQAGFRTSNSQIIRPYYPYESFPMHKCTIHYHYHATKNLDGH